MDNNIIPKDIYDIDMSQNKANSLQVAQQILNTDDLEQVKDLTNLFNLNMRKKNVLRTLKMDSLLDKVTDQVIERFEKRPDNFSNEDLIKYMQVTENAIDRANKHLNLVEETPAINLMQNNQVNINIDTGLDRDGRERVMDAVKAILAKAALPKEEDIIDVVEDGGNETDGQ